MYKFSTKIQQTEPNNILKIIYHDQVGFIPWMKGFFNNHKAINVMHHINKQKDKNDVIISRDAEKSVDKIQQPFMKKKKKTTSESRHRRNLPQQIKVIYHKITANILLNGKILKAFPLKSGTRPGCPLSALLFNSFESPTQSNQRRKRNKRDPYQKKRSKTLTVCR